MAVATAHPVARQNRRRVLLRIPAVAAERPLAVPVARSTDMRLRFAQDKKSAEPFSCIIRSRMTRIFAAASAFCVATEQFVLKNYFLFPQPQKQSQFSFFSGAKTERLANRCPTNILRMIVL
jgi:hypothetical protein